MGEGPSELARFPRPVPLEWIALAATLFLTLQYGWLLDDAFVYYRYVDNLLFLDRGLVFNEGEFVEGYSSPLWCLLMVPLRWIGLDWWFAVRMVGLVCAAGTWSLLVVLARRMSPRGTPIVNFPLLYLGFNYAVQTYFTSGVETPLVQLAAVAYALYVVAPSSRAVQWIVGLAPMIRHELAVPFVIAIAWRAWKDRRVPWTPIAVCAVSLGAWLVFRVVYYADLFPNTFYLKDEVEFARGWRYVHDTFVVYGVYWLVPSFGLLGWMLKRSGVAVDGTPRLVMLVAAASVIVYVAKIGGDPRHYRYLAFPFCLMACAAGGLIELAHLRSLPNLRPASATLTGAALAAVFFSMYPRQLSKHPISRDAEHTRVDEINDAQFHRLKPDLGFSPWTLGDEVEVIGDETLDFIWGDNPARPEGPSTMRTEYRRWRASGAKTSDLPVSPEGWCASAWKRFSQSLVHKDGLTDAFLARVDVPSWKAAHKRDLAPLSLELSVLRTKFGSSVEGFRAARESGAAPRWMTDHWDSIELVARKAFNRHDLWENLRLALTRVPRIDPESDGSAAH